MQIVQAIPFDHDGRTYQVVVSLEDSGYRVRAFLGDRPANGFSYSVQTQVQHDAIASRSFVRPLESLVDLAMADVRDGVWEQYLKSASDARWNGEEWS
jgi:hypothetical protein